MKIAIYLFSALLLGITLAAGPLDCNVYLDDEKLFFNLGDLQAADDYSMSLKFTKPDGTEFDGTFNFNFCTAAKKPSNDCIEATGTFGYIFQQGYCVPVSTVKTDWDHKAIKEEEEYKGLETIADNKGLALNLPFDLQYDVICSTEGTKMTVSYVPPKTEADRGYIHLVVNDDAGCPQDLSRIFKFIEDNPWVFGTVFCIFGAFMIFTGYRFFRYCLASIGFVVGFFGVLLITLWFWNYKSGSTAQFFFVIVASILVGVLLGYLFYSFTKIAMVGAGGFLGFLLGSLVCVLIQGMTGKDLSPVVYWIITGLFIIGLAILGSYAHDHVLIFSTAVSGSWLFVRGVGTMVGNYPDEETFSRKVKNGEWAQFPWEWWVYLSSLVILIILGLIVQFRHRSQKKKDGKGEDWKKELLKNDSFYE